MAGVETAASTLLFPGASLVPVNDADQLPSVLAQLKLKLDVFVHDQLPRGWRDLSSKFLRLRRTKLALEAQIASVKEHLNVIRSLYHTLY